MQPSAPTTRRLNGLGFLSSVMLALLVLAPLAWADPCGMVPPVTLDDDTGLVRTGDQQTYVFFKDGVETFVIRPGFSGKVEDFGMLIPFPTPPAVRKVAENIFPHVAAAIDPPEVVVDLRHRWHGKLKDFNQRADAPDPAKKPRGLMLAKNQVRVLKEEAVGMYEVAVLEAGSPAALKRWMRQHKYKYPGGMDKVCEEYIGLRWCFVAVKTKVGGKAGVDPQPGMREVKAGLPKGAAFDGHVQAMGFRFQTKDLVVPMRLSAFNEGELHNVVYLLTDGPRKIRSIPEEYVVRQVGGAELFRNVTGPLPLRILGGTTADIPPWRRKSLPAERDPAVHNGSAKELFAADVLAVKQGRLSHPYEEDEKMLLRVGERLGLRGAAIDKLHATALQDKREKAVQTAVADLKHMTLTVIDGDFPREVLSGKNLAFAEYQMPLRRNKAEHYDAKIKKPAGRQDGVIKLGRLEPLSSRPSAKVSWQEWSPWAATVGFVLLGLAIIWRRPN